MMNIKNVENLIGFSLPNSYREFLEELKSFTFDIGDTGICLYHKNALVERNKTYEVQEYSPSTLMIGQDGDIGFYIQRIEGDKIFSLDLGALGTLEMNFEAENIKEFIATIDDNYLTR